MQIVERVRKTYTELPPNLKRFLIRGLILFIAWELLYNFLMEPTHIPDDQLTHIIVLGTYKVLSWFYTGVTFDGASIFIDGRIAVIIAPSCNGLELLVLFWGFLVCLPTNAKRFWGYALIGTVIICVLNILRCAALAVMFYNKHALADFAHHYAFKLILYGVIFYMWVLYSKQYTRQNAEKE